MSNRFASSFPPLLAGSPLQAEGSPAVPAVPGTDPTPTPRRPASPVALCMGWALTQRDAGAAPGPSLQNLPKFRGAGPPARTTPGGSPVLRAPHSQPHCAEPVPPIHPSIHPGRSPTCCKEPQQQQQHAQQQQQRVQQQQQLLFLCRAILCPWRVPPRPARPRGSRGRWKALVASWQGSLPSQKGPAVAPHRPAG